VIWHPLNGSPWATFGRIVGDGDPVGAVALPPWRCSSTEELIAPTHIVRRKTMLDLTPPTTLNRDADRVEESARKLYERINPKVRDRDIPADAPKLPVYDWEIASDTSLDLDDVRSALRALSGRTVSLRTVNDEHVVVALTQSWVADVA
jgi:hypothetical protein